MGEWAQPLPIVTAEEDLDRDFERRLGESSTLAFRVAYGVLRHREDAEDVAQEAFVRAWKHAGSYDARRGSVVTWLLTITRNLAIDSVRVRRPVAIDPDAIIGLDRASGDRDLQELAELGDDVARLRLALARLPVEQRRAVVLAGLLGYTAREVGEIEDIPLGTAKTRIRTALLRLRAAMSEEEPAE